MQHIGIVGFGFAGLMVAANLVRRASEPMTLYVIDERLEGLGVAYSTRNPEHLLNVVAGRMSAFADAPDDFIKWLAGADAARAKQTLGLGAVRYSAEDFVPRALYGAYLQSIWRETQELAAQKKLVIKLVPSTAVALEPSPLAALTARGDAIALDRIVLATGNENKPLPLPPGAPIIQDPWADGAMDGVSALTVPVVLIGTGLTSVDTLLSLRRHGYVGEIIAGSLRGLWPQVHADIRSMFAFDTEQLFAQKTLRELLRFVRRMIAKHQADGGDWRAVIDALRPHSQALWVRAGTADQRRFLRHVMTYWSTHRHRMAPEIATRIEAEIAAGTLRSISRGALQQFLQHGAASRIYNCTGPQLNLQQSRDPLWRQMLAESMVEPHVTCIGLASDTHYRPWGNLYTNLYAIGSMMTGQWLESTAVPELRAQAARIAESLLQPARP